MFRLNRQSSEKPRGVLDNCIFHETLRLVKNRKQIAIRKFENFPKLD